MGELNSALSSLSGDYSKLSESVISSILEDAIRDNWPELSADPTGFVSKKLSSMGLAVPDGFHLHILGDDGNLYPPEDDDITHEENRSVFNFSPGSGFTPASVNKSGHGTGSGNCNGCRICVIVVK